ncbi:hypothetical protein NQ318_013902 [Aromia moschata]|uniref:Major facilitator superfamily (MFS) profile domain-containing protein n=1 Tax=Aromia moschata TaxID=1265417 RepID=A0AAV8ZA48_9CUCU|nr:hypothetical protein NQ318_013902 [Aromia moschata]
MSENNKLPPVSPVLDLPGHLDGFSLLKPKRENVDFEEALEETGFGRYNVILILVCGVLLFAANVENYSVGFVVPAAECGLDLDSFKKGLLTSANFVGLVVSSPLWGYISDIRGRRRLIITNLCLSFVTGVAAAVTPSFWGFSALRLLNGACMAGPGAICFVYLGEFLYARTRAKSMASTVFFVSLALTHLPALGWLLLQKTYSLEFLGLRLNNWRTFMLLNSTPGIAVALALCWMPESPRYLYYSGRPGDALKVLKKMYATNTGLGEDAFPVRSLDEKVLEAPDASKKASIWRDLRDQIGPLFRPPLLTYTLAACSIQAGLFAISSGLFFWYPDIINQVARSGKESVTVCEALSAGFETAGESQCSTDVDDRVFILNIVIGAFYGLCFAAWGVLDKMLGTKKFYISCMVISAVATALICVVSQKVLIDAFFVSALTISGMCVSIVNCWVVKIFPTHVAGMALCVALTAGRLGSLVSSLVAGVMLEWNCTVTIMLYAVNLIVRFKNE